MRVVAKATCKRGKGTRELRYKREHHLGKAKSTGKVTRGLVGFPRENQVKVKQGVSLK